MSCDKFIMLEGSDSFRTWQGLKGAHFTPHVNEDGLLTWTNDGNLQNPAPTNIRGPAGQGLQISGIADSYENLPDSQPIGSVWLVGDDSPYEAYAFFGEWIDIGEVQVGPQGPKGDKGDKGDQGDDYVLTNADKAEISAIVIANTGIGEEPLETEATTVKGAINELYEGKVDKVTGKGLSTNDYDNTEKSKVTAAGTNITNLQTKVGSAALDTTNKNLSGAVNELNQNVNAKVAKAGDTMTGNLIIHKDVPMLILKDPILDITATSFSVNRYQGVQAWDKNNKTAGYLQWVTRTSNVAETDLVACRTVNGTQVTNQITLTVDQNGNGGVWSSHPAAWRKALNTVLYYTGQAVSATTGQIMRIPASGTSAAITTDTVVLDCTFAAPKNITSDVTWTSYAGYITFTGTCTAATTANVVLGNKSN